MRDRLSTGHRLSRRALFPALLGFRAPVLARKGVRFAPEVARYADPSTEFLVTRLTNPSYASILPEPYSRFVSRNGDSLLFSSDRDGSLQAYLLDVGSGETRLLTEATALVPNSVQLVPGDGDFVYFDGPRLEHCRVRNLRQRRVYEIPSGWRRGRGLSVSSDGDSVSFVETNGTSWRIRVLNLRRDKVRTVLDDAAELSDPLIRPDKDEILFRKGRKTLWIARFGGRDRQLTTPPGDLGPALWVNRGRSVAYLHFPQEPGQLNALRDHFADSRQDRLIGKTTQFVSFSANRNSSVFVAASGGKATPYVLLMLRSTGREFTLCEHRASNPAVVNPVFSPNSRRIFFQSDRDGKSAIYSMDVRELVEATEDADET